MRDELVNRVRSLEEWRTEQDTRIAVEREQRKHMDERFDRLDTDIQKISRDGQENAKEVKGIFTKIVWAFFLSLMALVTNFIFKGGLII